jgi:hypothetical protein
MMEVKIKISGIDKISKFLKTLPKEVRRLALYEIQKYIIGGTDGGLRKSPPYKFVKRARAYGKVSDAPAGYFSWKQFRYVAWLTEGFTKFYKRTGGSSAAWTWEQTSRGMTIHNKTQAAYYTRDDKGQARQPALVGWRKAGEVVRERMEKAMKLANSAVNKYLRSQK